jgi:hypothetical protein
MDEKKRKEIQYIDNTLEISINQEKKSLRDSDLGLSKGIDEKFYSLKLEIAKEKKVREEASEGFMNEVADKLRTVELEIEKEQ